MPNRCSTFASVAEEREARADAVSKQMRLLRQALPALRKRLEQIHDPGNPRKRRHKLTILLLYGRLMFVFQFASRRETNRLSEFLEYAPEHSEAQDCERRALARWSDRLKTCFPRLPILLLLGGLYANGPVMQRCRSHHWQLMIVLKDQDLSTV